MKHKCVILSEEKGMNAGEAAYSIHVVNFRDSISTQRRYIFPANATYIECIVYVQSFIYLHIRNCPEET